MNKKFVVLTALAGLALGASVAFAGYDYGTGIVGSKHDMTRQTSGIGDPKGRVCAFCHTPHHKLDASKLDYNPLWSHEINNEDFVPYGEKSLSFAATIYGDPLSGPSRLCMSCHDGKIAVDQHYGMDGTASGGHLQGNDFGQVAIGLGNDVSTTHPIGFIIEDALNKAMNNGMAILGETLNRNLVAKNNTKLNNVPMQALGYAGGLANTGPNRHLFTCASCHEVHNKYNVDEAFLFEKQNGSQICLMCHNK